MSVLPYHLISVPGVRVFPLCISWTYLLFGRAVPSYSAAGVLAFYSRFIASSYLQCPEDRGWLSRINVR